ncbi:MAG: V-type ATP synthase subunit E [Spirochaetaceae bacterium]|nr:MAG: V-type ATP synthase subunit E [Spirochaetaceae bacterium]
MDAQLKELIETIKTEGVETAEARAQEIVDAAQKRADDIVHAAKQEADEIRKHAQDEARKSQRSGEAALKQAARDLILSVRNRLLKIFEHVVVDNVDHAYTESVLSEAIVASVKSFAEKGETTLDILVSEKSVAAIESAMRKELTERLKTGVQISGSASVKNGFRVSEENGSVYYDFTAEGVAEALSAHLTPRLQTIIQNADLTE